MKGNDRNAVTQFSDTFKCGLFHEKSVERSPKQGQKNPTKNSLKGPKCIRGLTYSLTRLCCQVSALCHWATCVCARTRARSGDGGLRIVNCLDSPSLAESRVGGNLGWG